MPPRSARAADVGRPPVAPYQSPSGPGPLRLFLFTLFTIVASTAFQILRSGATIHDVPHYFSREGPIAELWQMGKNASEVTLYGSQLSTCTQRVELVLKEKNVPYNFIPVNMREKEHKSESFLQKQPFGQVPVLVDGPLQLYESRAIARYIAASYPFRGTPLYPTSNLTRLALTEQAASVEASDFDPVLSGLLGELVYKGVKPDAKRVETLKQQLKAKMEGYERILSKQTYLAGNALTIADLFHLPVGTAAIKKLGLVWHEDFPHVERWWKDISGRPAWKEISSRYEKGP